MSKNFSEQGLNKALAEIKKRHKQGYQGLLKTIITQIKNFYKTLPEGSKLVFGLSGGIDSTTVTYLLVKAVGAKNVMVMNLPARADDEGIDYYRATVKKLKLENYFLDIGTLTQTITKEITHLTKTPLDLVGQGNIAARLRVNFFYALARIKKGYVIGTSNRTEFVQGYATKYGTPISCDFGIVDELYKTDVRELAKLLGIPQSFLTKIPSTGFYKGQTHEQELGAAIEEQDAAAYLLFEKRLSVEQIVKHYGTSKSYLNLMIDRYQQCEHKRRLQSHHVTLGKINDATLNY
ncbi:MAG: NAD(+) synthase [Nanoarchaeota archaeon]|nr:NAD(+) synthase [Nanoarchaeota archaeon]